MNQVAIKVVDLTVSYQKKTILKHLNLNIYHGRLTSILGSSGAGKSSLINAMLGFIKTNPQAVVYLNKEDQANLGYVFQDALLYENISVYQNLALSLKNTPGWKIKVITNQLHALATNQPKLAKWCHQLIQATKLKPHWLFYCAACINSIKVLFNYPQAWIKYLQALGTKKQLHAEIVQLAQKLQIENILKNQANKISGGQRQRVAIGKALIKNCQIIFLDEPFSSLDANTKTLARDWLRTIQQQYQLTVVLVTHDQNDAMLISDYIGYLAAGQIQQFGVPESIFDLPKNLAIAQFIGYPKINLIKTTPTHHYYIRAKYLNISFSPIPTNYQIQQIINPGNFLIYLLQDLTHHYQLAAYSNNHHLKVGDYVNLSYDHHHLLKFDLEGNNCDYQTQN